MMYEIPASTLASVIGILAAAAITPGPNNIIVMEAGARGGIPAAGAAMLGVLSGSVILLALVWWGIGAIFASLPLIKLALGLAGGAYLVWLGVALARQGGESSTQRPSRELPTTLPAIAAFQLVNPKAWVLVTTAASMMPPASGLALAVLMVLVTGVCLAVWAVAGAAAATVLERPAFRLAFNRVMGALLVISAAGGVGHALTE
jgi:threonine/homoserine/homoserine lactone efflux protein